MCELDFCKNFHDISFIVWVAVLIPTDQTNGKKGIIDGKSNRTEALNKMEDCN